jgi:opacity protein-like surface antigen
VKKLLSLLMFLSTSSFATVNQIELNLGRGTPVSSIQAGGSSDRDGSRGTDWSADFLHLAGPQYYFGVGGGQFRSNDNVSETFVPNANTTIRSKVSSILLLSRTDLPSQTKMVPYFIAGIGWVKNSLSVTSLPQTVWSDTGTSEQRTLVSDSKNTVGFAAGAGLDYALVQNAFIGIEFRYQSSLSRNFDLTAVGNSTVGQGSLRTSMNILMLGVKAGIKY